MSSAAISQSLLGAERTGARTSTPLLLHLLVLFVFFLPLKSVEVPSIVAGFSINPARLFITLALGVALIEGARGLGPVDRWRISIGSENPYVWLLLAYFFASVLYYYASLSFGNVVLFGSADTFFRSWKGRPVAQYVSLLTYAVGPYYLVRRFAQDRSYRLLIERALAASIVLLIVYGFFQQVSFYSGLPVTGRILYEGSGVDMRVPAYTVQGFTLLRFYSLGGEPREFGAFLVGGVLFLAYWYHGRRSLLSRGMLVAAGLALALTLSTSAFLAAALTAAALTVDAVWQRRVTTRVVAGSLAVALIIAAAAVYGNAAMLAARTTAYLTAFSATFGSSAGQTSELLAAQSADLGGIYYILSLPQRALHVTVFGFGFGNYTTGMVDILTNHFGQDLRWEDLLEDTRSYGLKLLVEVGIAGLVLYFLMFGRTLIQARELAAAARRSGVSSARLHLVRSSYIAFFIAGLVQISFYHFVIMGLIAARYAALKDQEAFHAVRST
jgi:hypothetical protein